MNNQTTEARMYTASNASTASSNLKPGAMDAARTLGGDGDIGQHSAFTRWKRAVMALAKVARNPEDTAQVLVFSANANAGTMKRRVQRFYADARGAKLFEEKRAIDSRTVDLAKLAALPEGTLGHAYAQFLTSRGLTPEIFDGSPSEFGGDPQVAYLVQRTRQTHDLWHVVTGYETNPAGEVMLQAFTFAQTGAPSTAILALLGTLRGTLHRRTLAKDVIIAFRRGRAADRLALFAWEDYWATPLEEVRVMLGVPPEGAAVVIPKPPWRDAI
ncbi:MAG: Coq4 family protein [Kofleriaceae bacterium]|nr:Coq4 family protein [Kofleriaceae bacterium]